MKTVNYTDVDVDFTVGSAEIRREHEDGTCDLWVTMPAHKAAGKYDIPAGSFEVQRCQRAPEGVIEGTRAAAGKWSERP